VVTRLHRHHEALAEMAHDMELVTENAAHHRLRPKPGEAIRIPQPPLSQRSPCHLNGMPNSAPTRNAQSLRHAQLYQPPSRQFHPHESTKTPDAGDAGGLSRAMSYFSGSGQPGRPMRKWLRWGLGSLSKRRPIWNSRSRMTGVRALLCGSANAEFILFPCGFSYWLGDWGAC